MKSVLEATCRFCDIDDKSAEHLLCTNAPKEDDSRKFFIRSSNWSTVDIEGYKLFRVYKFSSIQKLLSRWIMVRVLGVKSCLLHRRAGS